jgi:hypothetical protein
MKKFFVISLIAGITTGAFAEFRIGWTFDLSPNLFRLEAPTGDYTKASLLKPELDPTSPIDEMNLVEAFNDKYRGINYEFLTGGGQAGGTAWNRGTENRIRLWLTGEYYEVYTRIRADEILSNLMRGSNPSSVGIFHYLSNAVFDDWYIRGILRMFRVIAGNYDHRGRTQEYATFHEFTRNRQDFFGIHLPNVRIPTSSVPLLEFQGVNDSTESTNLRSAYKHGNNDYKKDGSNAFWLFETGFNDWIGVPLFFEVFGDMADFTRPAAGNFNPTPGGWYKLNGGLRISGDKIAGKVSFDAMYRIKGGDEYFFDGYTEMEDPNNPGSTIDNGMHKQPDNNGRILHHFGLYGNLAGLVDGFGISFGYTGMVRTYEKYFQFAHTGFETGALIPNRELSFAGPYYSGIDLRLNYTGIEGLGITFNNNVSFAAATGTDLDKDSTMHFIINLYGGQDGMGPTIGANGQVGGDAILGKNETQSWFALYNALALSFRLAGNLTAFFNCVNRYGRLTEESMGVDADPGSATKGYKNKPATVTFSRNDLMGVLGVTYTFTGNITLHGGLSLRYITDTTAYEGAYHSQAQVKTQNSTLGTLTFAIPLWMRISF